MASIINEIRGIFLNQLKKIAEDFAHNRKINGSRQLFKITFPKKAENGLSDSEWEYTKYIIRRCGSCRTIVINNLDKLNFLETYIRLRIYYLEKKEKDEFRKMLYRSKIQAIKTLIKLQTLDMETIKKWDPSIEKSDFEKIKTEFPYGFLLPPKLINLTYSMRNNLKLIPFINFKRNNVLILIIIILIISISTLYLYSIFESKFEKYILIITFILTIIGSILTMFNFLKKSKN